VPPEDHTAGTGDSTQTGDSSAQGAPLRQLPSLDPPMVPFVLGGMGVWLLLGLVGLALRSTLAEQGREHWITICFAGFLVAIPGLALMIVHDRNRRRRRAAAPVPPRNGP
jgi:hypothetical protein